MPEPGQGAVDCTAIVSKKQSANRCDRHDRADQRHVDAVVRRILHHPLPSRSFAGRILMLALPTQFFEGNARPLIPSVSDLRLPLRIVPGSLVTPGVRRMI